VLEVEGMRQVKTAAKIGHYFDSKDDRFARLEFAILVCYSCGATGPAHERSFRLKELGKATEQLVDVSKRFSNRDFYLVVVHKVPEQELCSIRQGKYYCGRICSVKACWYQAGVEVREKVLFGDQDHG
jgi:hypothetical protein